MYFTSKDKTHFMDNLYENFLCVLSHGKKNIELYNYYVLVLDFVQVEHFNMELQVCGHVNFFAAGNIECNQTCVHFFCVHKNTEWIKADPIQL
jgi:hypothetical protein